MLLTLKHDHSCLFLKPINCIWLIVAFIGIAVGYLKGQTVKTDTAPEQKVSIRIGVDEVRIDAVVLDNKGRQIADLTADDFEVYQDDQRQRVTACGYITATRAGIEQEEKGAGVPVSIRREEVRRTIVFIVDDLSMGFTDLYRARMSLQKFVEAQMQQGDLVAIMRTSTGIGALQLFSSDRKQLLTEVGDVRWGNGNFSPGDFRSLFDAQLSTIRYCIQGMKPLPGRKSIFLITTLTILPGDLVTSFREPLRPNYRRLYIEQYNRLADEALRGNVVIHTLDIRGLEAPGTPGVPGNIVDAGTQPKRPENMVTTDSVMVPQWIRDFEKASKEIPLSEKTGGVFLKDSNFFLNGIGSAYEELAGYYLLSYVPPNLPSNQAKILSITASRSG